MILLSLFLCSMFILSLILVSITNLFSLKSLNIREKWTAFECGFNFFNSARMPFSMRFFLIAIIFIIFDVEITLVLPLIPTFIFSNIKKWVYSNIIILVILILGMLIEWKQNSFEWKY